MNSAHTMTNAEIFAYQRKEAEWRKTPIGAAFTKFKNTYSRAWIVNTEAGFRENTPDKRLREVWEIAEKAEQEFRQALADLEAKAEASTK